MSDTMLLGVLRMPPELWDGSPLDVSQRYARYVEAADRIESADARCAELRDVLLRRGFVPCDLPECNCGSWHWRYGLPERMQELKDLLSEAGHPLSNENGNLPSGALRALVSERDELRAEVERLRSELAEAREEADDGALIVMHITQDEALHDEFLTWYKPGEWLNSRRAACSFVAMKLWKAGERP